MVTPNFVPSSVTDAILNRTSKGIAKCEHPAHSCFCALECSATPAASDGQKEGKPNPAGLRPSFPLPVLCGAGGVAWIASYSSENSMLLPSSVGTDTQKRRVSTQLYSFSRSVENLVQHGQAGSIRPAFSEHRPY